MNPRRICCVLGTRPEAIKLAPVILALRRHPSTSVTVISTGQHRELLADVLSNWDIKLDEDLALMTANQRMSTFSAEAISGLTTALMRYSPDTVIVQGDTTSAFAAAYVAFLLQVSVVHVEAGLRTYDRSHPFPEEVNRRLIAQIADLHFAPTESAKENLCREGIDASTIFVTGNTVIDALLTMFPSGLPDLGNETRRVVVTVHRRENHGAPLASICSAIVQLANEFPDIEFIWPVHPNPNVSGFVTTSMAGFHNIRLLNALPYKEFVELLGRSTLIMSDSGGVQEESAALGVPALVLREATERIEGLHVGLSSLVGTNRQAIVDSFRRVVGTTNPERRPSDVYGKGDAGTRIAGILMSE